MSWHGSVEFVKHGWTPSGGLVVRSLNEVQFDSHHGTATIPVGALSDGASVPRVFWNIFSPFDGDYFDAAFLHDVIYRDPNTRFTRKQADEIFLEAMESLGVGWWKRNTVYRAVRMCGWKPWNEHRKQKP